MNRNKTIDYVEFHADNLPATRQFYSQVFGWEFEDYGPEYTSFKDGRIAGGFSLGPVSPGAGPLIVIYVDDLQATQLQIREAGGKLLRKSSPFPGDPASTLPIQAGTSWERGLRADAMAPSRRPGAPHLARFSRCGIPPMLTAQRIG